MVFEDTHMTAETKILDYLRQNPDKSFIFSELQEMVGLSSGAVQYGIKKLLNKGLIIKKACFGIKRSIYTLSEL